MEIFGASTDYTARRGCKTITQRRKGCKDAKKKSALNFASLHPLRLCVNVCGLPLREVDLVAVNILLQLGLQENER